MHFTRDPGPASSANKRSQRQHLSFPAGCFLVAVRRFFVDVLLTAPLPVYDLVKHRRREQVQPNDSNRQSVMHEPSGKGYQSDPGPLHHLYPHASSSPNT